MKRFFLPSRVIACVFMVVLLFAVPVYAKHLHLEKYYQAQWCNEAGGTMEYRLDDGARVDCLTETYAIEFDFASKWAESIGQSLFYAIKTGKKPGVVLILEHPLREQQFLKRLETVGGMYEIKIWTISPEKLEKSMEVTR